MDIDESYGVEPWSDEDYAWPPEPKDDAGDACQYWDNVREERMINRQPQPPAREEYHEHRENTHLGQQRAGRRI
jgi:hypothetical protein